MSATGRGRRLGGPEDFYATPAWCVRRLLDVWHPTERGTWLEPSAGNGAIIRAANGLLPGLSWGAIEVREEERATLEATGATVEMGDFLASGTPWFRDVSVVIGNPPFALAMEFIDRALTLYQDARVAFLLRLNFAGSEERSGFMRARPPSVYVLPNRPAFRDGQTDSCEYAWFVWPRGDHRERDAGHFRVLAPTPASERDQKLVARGRTLEVAQGDLFKIPELGSTAQRQGRASQGDVPATERLSSYCPHGDRGMQNAPEEAAQPRYRGATPPRVKAEGVTGGRDPQLFGSNEQPQQRGENADT